MQEGAVRLLSNLDSAMRNNRRASHGLTQPRSLQFDKFKLNDKLREIENKKFINPAYFEPNTSNFDIRRNH